VAVIGGAWVAAPGPHHTEVPIGYVVQGTLAIDRSGCLLLRDKDNTLTVIIIRGDPALIVHPDAATPYVEQLGATGADLGLPAAGDIAGPTSGHPNGRSCPQEPAGTRVYTVRNLRGPRPELPK